MTAQKAIGDRRLALEIKSLSSNASRQTTNAFPSDDLLLRTNTMAEFHMRLLPDDYDVLAPDGSEVRVLLALAGGSMAHFRLAPGQTSLAVMHRTVEEIWYVVSGRGEMWRKCRDHEEVVALSAGVCLTIPVGTEFQFRATGEEPLAAIGVTMPPWPGEDEAIVVRGVWEPTAAVAPV